MTDRPVKIVGGMAPSERTFRGQTAQQRRDERRGKLLDAALDLIGTDGWSSATMTAICSRAGLTERYFYESFTSRDELYLALIDGIGEDTERAVLTAVAATAAQDATVRLRAVVTALMSVLLDDPRRGRVALLEGLGSEVLQRRRREIVRGLERLVRDHGEAISGRPVADPRGLEIDAVMLAGAASELISRRLDGSLDVADGEVADRITALAVWMVTRDA